MRPSNLRTLLAGASLAALTALPMATASHADSYSAGDFHNHTTCTDGATSVQTMISTSINQFRLEWLADAGHGGTSVRDCRYDDPEADGPFTGSGAYYINTIPLSAFQGDSVTSSSFGQSGAPAVQRRAMWRWQNLQQYNYPETARVARSLVSGGTYTDRAIYLALETNVPGHEHTSMGIISGQNPFNARNPGNANAISEFEYRFDRSDNDLTGPVNGSGQQIWTGKVANPRTGLIQPGNVPSNGGQLGHTLKAVPSVAFLQANYPTQSYYVPAHVERAGAFQADVARGFNIEHFRDFNNAGPTVAFGFETMPGHQAAGARGEYQAGFSGPVRDSNNNIVIPAADSVGVSTRGGVGVYGAQIGGLWDAMLAEGRNFFFFASSDFHNRGSFSPFVRQSTADFYPGEYQKDYIPTPRNGRLTPQLVVNALRAGNSYVVAGDLIGGDLTFTAQGPRGRAARMGETLVVRKGDSVTITMTVTDPDGTNNAPYSFANPLLAQVGITQPINAPVLDHVDFIRGSITGIIDPTDTANYAATPTVDFRYNNSDAAILRTFAGQGTNQWVANGTSRTMTFTIDNIQNSQYVRVRGTSNPPAVPFTTDAQGNPLRDDGKSNVPCPASTCPAHVNGVVNFDVEGWSDLWFYTNPIFIRVDSDPELRVETNARLARSLARGTQTASN